MPLKQFSDLQTIITKFQILRIDKKKNIMGNSSEGLEISRPQVSLLLTSYGSLQRNIKMFRRRNTIPFSLLKNGAQFQIPDLFRTTLRHENSALYDGQEPHI
ncbi:hypothetical protein RF11_05650 [Thelohanellus kitauei]|uniref:Uncharacterized protein n=1 Tax=Thelohanellus kitauei TaxID=669202 RepID=A0A0C2MD39_THEKT|nr:hypothetical protein RF11_05650 [Thelohanellus kitauei]